MRQTVVYFQKKERNAFIGWDLLNTIYMLSYLQVRFTIIFNCYGTLAFMLTLQTCKSLDTCFLTL